MSENNEEIIQKIIQLGQNNNADAQNEACQLIYSNFFVNNVWSDVSVIPRILPLIIQMIGSQHLSAQEDALFFAIKTTLTSSEDKTEQEYTRDVIDAGGIPILLENLSLPVEGIVIKTLKCCTNIAYWFPEELITFCDAISTLMLGIEEDPSKSIMFHAVELLKNMTCKRQQNLRPFLVPHILVPLLNLVEKPSRNRRASEESLYVLANLVSFDEEACEYILDHGVLKLVKKLLFSTSSIKSPAIKFFEKVTVFNVDAVIAEGIVPEIIKNIKEYTISEQIKKKSLKLILNMIKFKPSFLPNLLNFGIVPAISRNFRSTNNEFLVLALSALDEVIQAIENNQENVERKLRCGALSDLKKLFEHEEETIQVLSKQIYEYFAGEDDINSSVVVESNHHLDESSEFDDSGESESEDEVVVRRPKRSHNESSAFRQPPAKKSKNASQGEENTFAPETFCVTLLFLYFSLIIFIYYLFY